MTATRINAFTTHDLSVKWAHLHEPDVKFGEDSANHSVTVIVDTELQKQLDTLKKENKAKKINGLSEDDEGNTYLKAKSKLFIKKGNRSFPCRDAAAALTEAVAFGGDVVRLRLAPTVLSRDGSMSLFLNGVQIIEKKPWEGENATGGFEVTDGFDGSDFKAPVSTATTSEEEMGDIPF